MVIIAILAIVAVPNYTKAKEKALGKEALANLKIIAAAEKIYRVEETAYVECICTDSNNCERTSPTPLGCNYLLKLDLNPENWEYSVNDAGGGVWQCCANRVGQECWYCVNMDGDLSGSSGSCPR